MPAPQTPDRYKCTIDGAPAACYEALRIASVEWQELEEVCDLRTMRCEMLTAASARGSLLSLDHVQPGLTQLQLRLGGIAEVVLTRDSIR